MLFRSVKSRKPAPGVAEILLPGEHARLAEAEHLKTGLQVDDETWAELIEVASELQVPDLPKPL